MSAGGREYLMRAHFSLPSIVSEEVEGKPPINVKFEIPYYTTSGLQVGNSSRFFGVWPYKPNQGVFSTDFFLKAKNLKHKMKIFIFPGPLPENHREERLPSTALGSLRHAEWRLSAENELIDKNH